MFPLFTNPNQNYTIMEVIGHHNATSCVVGVAHDDTILQLKQRIIEELDIRGEAAWLTLRAVGCDVDLGEDATRVSETSLEAGDGVDLVRSAAAVLTGSFAVEGTCIFLVVSPCARYIAVACDDENTFIHSTETHARLTTLTGTTYTTPVFSPCSQYIASGSIDLTTQVHHIPSGTLKFSLPGGHRESDLLVGWSPCGRYFLSVSNPMLRVYDAESGSVIHEWDNVDCGGGYNLPVTHDSVLIERAKQVVAFRNYQTGVCTGSLDLGGSVYFSSLSEDGQMAAACGEQGKVRVWQVSTQELLHDLTATDNCDLFDISVSSSGNVLAAYSKTNIFLWSLQTGALLRTIPHGSTEGEFGVVLSRCGQWLFHVSGKSVSIVLL